MDAVVSVDTSLAHLAGALGKDMRLLLSRVGQDWRWLTGRSDTPWYPTMRLYRQGEDGDWAAPLDAVARDLAGLC
jgi:ADP-heptose:LPS heptosyltransferase